MVSMATVQHRLFVSLADIDLIKPAVPPWTLSNRSMRTFSSQVRRVVCQGGHG